MRGKQGDTKSGIPSEAGTGALPSLTLPSLYGAICIPALILAGLATSGCHGPDIQLIACTLIQGHTGRGRKEGVRQGGRTRGGGISAAKKTKLKVGGNHTQKAGEEAEIYRPVSCFLRSEI